MRWLRQSSAARFPARAPTQTWMFLTFAGFVGLTAGGVTFYLTLDLGNQIHRAAHQSHMVDTEYLSSIILSADLTSTVPGGWVNELDPSTITLLQLEDIRIFIGHEDSLYWNSDPLGNFDIHSILIRTQNDIPFFDILTEESSNQKFKVGAIRQGEFVIGLLRPVSALYTLSANMRNKIIAGIGLALFMSMLGAWIASMKVTKPLQTIIKATQQITSGEYDTPIRVSSRAAEFQDLGHHLEYMSKMYLEKIRELEKVTRLQNEFISNISHEVRNPIFAISGFLEALGASTLSETRRQRYIAKGLLNLRRLSNLFGSLIDIARLESRDQPLRRSKCNLAALVDDIKEILTYQAEKKDLQFEFDQDDIWVFVNEDQIRQVFLNLVNNAILYSSSGIIRIHFHRRLDKVQVEVIDDGLGIPEEHLDLIFERFHRVNDSRSRQNGGSGLGLAIVKQVLREHGEAIHVESILGRGSRFWFELPLAPEH